MDPSKDYYGVCNYCGKAVKSQHSFIQVDDGHAHLECLKAQGPS